MTTGSSEYALERAQEEADPEGHGPFVLAAVIAAAFALQQCYDPARAPPIDPSPTSTVSPDVRTRDAGGDR